MAGKLDIHGYQNKIDKLDKYLDSVSKTNKELILSFKNYLFTKNLSIPRILKYMNHLKVICDMVKECDLIKNKDLDKLTKQDIQHFVGIIQQKPYSPYTRHSFKIVIKKFICWAKNCEEGELPPEIKWLKTSLNKSELKLPGEGDLITKEEVEIRANTIWANEFIKEELKKKIPNISSIHVNDHLWLLGQSKIIRSKPYHLTRTTAY